ncbi:type III polyketide synthase [Rhizosaccharibacter radicis]|uniref:Type III polyketide synthase n=1 Tax=Rhizosaccharibacter radicis TaxID=2782605 RepID=A0ABT1VY88_9PROT|nr:type III polyketide synthase [Acetobacteraceae bacterium KSS12]
MTQAFLNAIGTATPPHDVHRLFERFALSLLPDDRARALFGRMAARSGMAHRFSVLAPGDDPAGPVLDRDGFYRRGGFPGTRQRLQRYEREALPLALAAVRELGDRLRPRTITHLIVTSCTGFYAPGLDIELVQALDLPDGVERTLIGFMGCHAAFNALRQARHIVRSEPHARVLVLSLELCTLHLQETASTEQILAFLLFADGCGAALVSAELDGLRLDGSHSARLPDTEPLIGWRIGDDGFDMVLSGRVPGAIADALRGNAGQVLGLREGDRPALWAVHPGGRSVLDGVAGGLDLPPDALDGSRAVLHEQGNMSSASILFVLRRLMAAAQPGENGIALGFGPGLTAESLRFTVS